MTKKTGMKRTDHLLVNVMNAGSLANPKSQAIWKENSIIDHGHNPKRSQRPKRDSHSVPGEWPANRGDRYDRDSGSRYRAVRRMKNVIVKTTLSAAKFN